MNAVPAAEGNLAISEIHYHPLAPTAGESALGYTSASMFEFIELQNVGAQNVDLTEVHVLDAIGFDFAEAPPPGSYSLRTLFFTVPTFASLPSGHVTVATTSQR